MQVIKSELIQFRVTKKDKEKITQDAEKRDMSMTDYIRSQLLKK